MFEGLALGTRIASVGTRAFHDSSPSSPNTATNGNRNGTHTPSSTSEDQNKAPRSQEELVAAEENRTDDHHSESTSTTGKARLLSMPKKLLMASAFALVTPVGMAIGTGVLRQFNGNDPSTLIALGTLDALSAGILMWVGIVEMWAGDWMFAGGELVHAGKTVTALGGLGLVGGMVLMSFLGKWA